MQDKAIIVNGLSKAYRIGYLEEKADTLAGAIVSAIKAPFKNFRNIKNLSRFKSAEENNIFWALSDINFEVKHGEVLGIIGRNGAGKSTLLKIISRITDPTSGRIEIHGRVASLLEVGTGFNVELTGRENVYLNGTILGMKKNEIDEKFNEIVEFSGIEKFIDTPVKRYSSGMKVRLAFAVAAHLDPEILIIDEVLAVGDVEFQNKCLGKMHDVAGQGRTVLFVSHQMPAVNALCTRCMVLRNGGVIFDGDVQKAIDIYYRNDSDVFQTGIIPNDYPRPGWLGEAKFNKVVLKNRLGSETNSFLYKEPISLEIEFEVINPLDDVNIVVMLGMTDGTNIIFQESIDKFKKALEFSPGAYRANLTIDTSLLPGSYTVNMGMGHIKSGKDIDWVERVFDFDVSKISVNADESYRWTANHGLVLGASKWDINEQIKTKELYGINE
jgi:lipopolysaccharide transport system ATP-binding protein